MAIVIEELDMADMSFSTLGRIENGEVVADDDGFLEELLSGDDVSDEAELLDRFNGPRLIAYPDTGTVSKNWIPYQGPMGGEGWQNANDPDDIRYVDDPPGEVEEGYEEISEGWGNDSRNGITNRSSAIEKIRGNDKCNTLFIMSHHEDAKDIQQKHQRDFRQSFSQKTINKVDKIFEGWSGSAKPNNIELFKHVSNLSGNQNYRDKYSDEIETYNLKTQEKNMINKRWDKTEDILREAFGEEIPVFRGIHGEAAEKLRQGNAEKEEVQWNHRPIASFSTDPKHAKSFAQNSDNGIVIRQKVPVTDAIASSHDGTLVSFESEIAFARPSSIELSPDQIIPQENLESEGEMLEQYKWIDNNINND